MAFQHQVWHVQALGKSYQGAEQWSMGFWMGTENADAGVPTTQDANQIFARIKTLFATAAVPISWAFVLTDVKIQHYMADGTMNKANTVFSSGVEAQAGQSNRNVPPQLALAVSFRGQRTRGPGSNGRMYLPGINIIPTATGHIEQNDVNAVLLGVKAMMQGINTDLAGRGAQLILATPGGKKPVTPPANVLVNQIRVGDVVDTIQRRRRGLRESYNATAI